MNKGKLIKISPESYDFLSWCKRVTNSSSYDETIKKLAEAMERQASYIFFWWDEYRHKKFLIESYPEATIQTGQEQCE